MLLQYLLEGIKTENITGKTDIEIGKIEYDSRKISKQDVFIAVEGYTDNGEEYIDDAVKKGAAAIIIGKNCKYKNTKVTIVQVDNVRMTMAQLASKYYENPASKLKTIGVTGTKGKTTTCYMIRDILLASGKKVGMIGTIFNTYGDKVVESKRTSPDSLDLQKLLRKMVDSGMEYVVMEVSSHALELYRVHGIKFVVGVFTNLSEDHLDFHETMDKYLEAKAKIFAQSDFGLINADDIYSSKLIKMIDCKMAKFGLDNEANITATDIKIGNGKTEFKMYVNKVLQPIIVNIPGRFTVYNALAAIGVTSMLGCQMDSILNAFNNVTVPGRSQVVDINKTFTVVIDYAHNTASLEAILANTKKYNRGRIICVFGCGGNRDVGKRSLMGEISGRLSDFTIITTDNPRNEEPMDIIKQIEEGIKPTKGLYKIIADRKEAIKFAMNIAWKNDTIVIAGKGHETYQEFKKGKRIDFDEIKIVKQIAKEMPIKTKRRLLIKSLKVKCIKG